MEGGCLRIWLTEAETAEEPMDRRVVSRLVRRAMIAAGRRPMGRLMAEMIPVEGGSLLLVSPAGRPDSRQPAVYRLADEAALAGLARRWHSRRDRSDTPPCLSLYEGEGGYGLAVYPVTPLTAEELHLLLEYGTLWGCGEAAVAHWGEYGRLIAAGEVLTAREPRQPVPEDPPH